MREEIHATTSGPFDALKCRRLFPFVSLARLLSLKVALFPPPILHLAVTSTKGASGIASPPPIIRLKVTPTQQMRKKKKKKKSGTAYPLLLLLLICLKVPPTHQIDKKIRRKRKGTKKSGIASLCFSSSYYPSQNPLVPKKIRKKSGIASLHSSSHYPSQNSSSPTNAKCKMQTPKKLKYTKKS